MQAGIDDDDEDQAGADLSGEVRLPATLEATSGPMPERAEIVIVGGGVVGLSIAYHLARRGLTDVVVIELGGNDALRGLPLASTRDNLTAMTRAAKAAGAQVLIAGMQVPPNYGRRYADDFARLFEQVARAEGTALLPFLLEGVANGPDAAQMFQPDRIHPTAQAHARILDNVWPVLRPLLPAPRRS